MSGRGAWRSTRLNEASTGLRLSFRAQGNGGFSLRRRSAMLNATKAILAANKYSPKDCADEDFVLAEAFVHDKEAVKHLATFDQMRAFSVETYPHPSPVGVHRPWWARNNDRVGPRVACSDVVGCC